MVVDNSLNYKKILKFTLYFVLSLLFAYLGIKLALFFLPFLIGFIVSKIIKKPVEFLNKKLKFPRPLAVVLSLFVFIGIIVGLCYLLISNLFRELVDLYQRSQYLFPAVYNGISYWITQGADFISFNLPTELVTSLQTSALNIINSVLTSLTNFVSHAVTAIINLAVALPNALVYIIITFLASFFISCDNKMIYDSLAMHIPNNWLNRVESLVNDLFKALGGYIRAQCIMICITFTELFIAFNIFNVNYALILAIIISIVDALPILGTGTVLIPWAIFNLATGNYTFAVCLIVLYLFVLAVRQLIEPKVVGTQIGIYPLLTLAAMYAGVQITGNVLGLIIGPIVLIIVKNVLSQIYEKGMLRNLFEKKDLA